MGLCSENLQIVISGHDDLSLKVIRNIYFLKCRVYTAGSADTQTDVGTDFMNAWQTNFLALLSVHFICDQVLCRNLDDPDDAGEVILNGNPGGVSGDSLPANDAIVVNWFTGGRGKTWRGKTHFALIPESSTDRDHVIGSGTVIADWKAAAAALIAGSYTGANAVNNYKLELFRPTATAGNFTPTGIESAPVIDYALNLVIGGMKRRKQRGSYA